MPRQALSSYPIGEIPRIFVTPGGKTSLILLTPFMRWAHWDLLPRPSSRLSYTVRDDRLFEVIAPYDAVDEETVTLVATYNDGTQERQDVEVAMKAPNENQYVGRGRPPPDEASASYMIIRDALSLGDVSMNHVQGKVRDVHISGKSLKIGSDGGGFIFRRLDGQKNIRSLVLEAEEIAISSPLAVPETDVTIRARRLRFETGSDGRSGSITTTPSPFVMEAQQSNAGSTGLKGGSVTIVAPHIDVGSSGPCFILTGGKGQKGHKGAPGADGRSMIAADRSSLPPGVELCRPADIADFLTGDPKVYIDFTYMTCVGILGQPDINGVWGVKTWPGDGQPGRPAGVPGEGGKSGVLVLPLEPGGEADAGHKALVDRAQQLVLLDGGLAGDKGSPDPAPGGKPGKPVTSTWVGFLGHDQLITAWRGAVTQRHIAKPGRPSPAPSARAPRGASGTIETPLAPAGSWLTATIVRAVVRYCEDLYLAGLTEQVIEIADEYERVFATMPNMDDRLIVEATRLRALRLQAESGLDYFGQRPGRVPLQPFTHQLSFYREEIDAAIRLLYLAHWLSKKMEKSEQTADSMKFLADQAEKNIRAGQQRISDLEHQLDELTKSHGELVNEIDLTRQEIREVETKIRQQAEANLRPKDDGFLSFLKVAATVATVFPVGQPAVGAVGVALNAIASADPNKPLETFLSVKSGIEQIDPNTLTGLRNDIYSRIERLNPKSAEDVGAYVKDVQVQYGELSKSVDEIRKAVQSAQAPRSAVEAEIERLKAADPAFTALAKKLAKLNSQKANFMDLLVAGTGQITNALSTLDRDVHAVNAFNQSMNAALSAINLQGVTSPFAQNCTLRLRDACFGRLALRKDWAGLVDQPSDSTRRVLPSVAKLEHVIGGFVRTAHGDVSTLIEHRWFHPGENGGYVLV